MPDNIATLTKTYTELIDVSAELLQEVKDLPDEYDAQALRALGHQQVRLSHKIADALMLLIQLEADREYGVKPH